MLDFSKFKNTNVKAAGIGEVLFDVLPTGARLGGAPANFAYHCGALGLPCTVISAVGRDEKGAKAKEELTAAGLDLMVYDTDFPTGEVLVKLSPEGVATYDFLEDTAYDHLPFDEALAQTARGVNLACYGSLAQRSEITAQSIRRFLSLMPEDRRVRVFDVNIRQHYYSRENIEATLRLSEAFKCNEDELPLLATLLGLPQSPEGFYQALGEKYGCELFIYTMGVQGSTVYLNDQVSRLPSRQVTIADTVGAGDSFTAALTTALMRGMDLRTAHEKAVAVSAYVCTRPGAMPKLPADLTAGF